MSQTAARTASRAALVGVLLSIGGYYAFNLGDATAKLMTRSLPVLEIVAAQSVVALALAPVLVPPRRLARLARAPRLPLLLLRSACQLASALSFTWAIKSLPLADVIAIGFVSPFVITVLAASFLGESVGPRRWGACIVGFVGALIILRPGLQMGWGTAALPVANAVFYAIYAVLTRALGHDHDARALLAVNGLVGGPVLLVLVAFVAVWPSPLEWLALAAIGLFSALGHLLVIQGYRLAPASLLAPFQYLEITGAVALGLVIFHNFPDLPTWLGIAVIIAAGLFVYYREAALARSQTPAADAGEQGSHP